MTEYRDEYGNGECTYCGNIYEHYERWGSGRDREFVVVCCPNCGFSSNTPKHIQDIVRNKVPFHAEKMINKYIINALRTKDDGYKPLTIHELMTEWNWRDDI